MLGEVYDRFLTDNQSLAEKPAAQLVFDLKYALSILSRDAADASSAPFLVKATSLLDPIDWSFLEEHVNRQVTVAGQQAVTPPLSGLPLSSHPYLSPSIQRREEKLRL